MAAPADEYKWIFTYCHGAPNPPSILLSAPRCWGWVCKTDITYRLVSWLPGRFCQYKALDKGWEVRGERRGFWFPVSVSITPTAAQGWLQSPFPCTLPTPATPCLLGCAAAEPHPPGHQKASCCILSPVRLHLSSGQPTPSRTYPRAPWFSPFYLFPATFCSYYLGVTSEFQFDSFQFPTRAKPIPCRKFPLTEILSVVLGFLTGS